MTKQEENWVCIDCGKNTGPVPDVDLFTIKRLLEMGRNNRCKACRSYIDRTHEECCECSLEECEPPLCKGHVAGPDSCSKFNQRYTESDLP